MDGNLIGKYRIIRKLGEGGMGILYEAHNEALDRRVAIKMLRPHLSANGDVARRLVGEARSAARIRHPGIVDVLDVDQRTNGEVYVVMEYLDGESLAVRLAKIGTMREATAVRLGVQMADALAAAHEAGIVHRDLKPDNIFLVPDPLVPGGERVKLFDFGIAKRMETEGGMETKVGVLLGTPPYMSPEQCRGRKDVDHRSDLYSLGVILFEMLCGRRPFNKRTAIEYINAHDSEHPPSARTLNPSVSSEVDALVARLLDKDPARRPQSAGKLVNELASLQATSVQPTSVQATSLQPTSPLPLTAAAPRLPAGGAISPAGKRRRAVAPTVRVAEQDAIEVAPTAAAPLDTLEELPCEATTNATDAALEFAPLRQRPRPLAIAGAAIAVAAVGIAIGLLGGDWLSPASLGDARRGAIAATPAEPASAAPRERAANTEAPAWRHLDVSDVRTVRDVVRLIQRGEHERAIAGIHKLRPSHTKSAYLPFLLGNLYFERAHWRLGITAYRDAIANNQIYAKKRVVIRNAISALERPKTRGPARELILDSIGTAALPELREVAATSDDEVGRQAVRLVERLERP